MQSCRLSYFIIFTVTHPALIPEATRPEPFHPESDLLVPSEVSPKTFGLEGVEVIPYVEKGVNNSSMKRKQIKPQVEALSMKVEPKNKLDDVEVVPYVEEEGEDTNFSAKPEPETIRVDDVAEKPPPIELEIEAETAQVAHIVEEICEEYEPKLFIKRKPKKSPFEGVSESLLSVKVKPSHDQEADDVVPIVEEEDEPDFSIKLKPGIEQVEDIALEWPQLIESPANETESGIYDASISKDEVREKGEPIASELIFSTPPKPFDLLSDGTTVQTEPEPVQPESKTIEGGVVAKPRKKSIKKAVEETQSIPQQATTTDTRKKPKKNVSKKDQSDKSVADLDLKSKSSKL